MFKTVLPKVNFPEMEEEILFSWRKNKIFEKSINRPGKKEFVFYDGPPFATGLPHYGHIVPGTLKDVIPRYFTMRGFNVERRFGWDCHGLPVEYELEKELGFSQRKEIEKMGIFEFNEACRRIVLRYSAEWEKIVERLGRWVDFKNGYKTMDPDYMESIWWVFKSLWEKGLIYQDYKSMHLCPRCATSLSNFEVTLGYKEVNDLSTVVKFKLKNEDISLLVWTTTPWTLPGNVLLAINPKINYLKINVKGESYIVASDLARKIFRGKRYRLSQNVSPKFLIGRKYHPLFPVLDKNPNAYQIVSADFVNLSEGTGIVHIAPAFGEDDLNLGQREKVPFFQHINKEGIVTDLLPEFKGISVFDLNRKVTEKLKEEGKIFSVYEITHSYPHCWRCETPLLNYTDQSWFVKVTKIKEQLLKNNEKIHWVPGHIKHGRFGKWLEQAKDWSVSRNRYWGTPLPVWQCECKNNIVIGSISELEQLSNSKVKDLHKHFIDKIKLNCQKCGKKASRVPEVLDCWFESGSMPYGYKHYPFEGKKRFEMNFPADFIAEGIDQTRGWFYTLHVLATALFDKPAFKNCVVSGIVLASSGEKMSKRKKNYPDPMLIVNTHGADALRFYLMNSPVIFGKDLRFFEKGVIDVVRNLILPFWNSYSFFVTYANIDKRKVNNDEKMTNSILDQWILLLLNILIKDLTSSFEKFNIYQATRYYQPFINNLSAWYIRRSRDRIGPTARDKDGKNSCYSTLYKVLTTFSKLIAPFMPFLAEEVYRNLTNEESVHLADWPGISKIRLDASIRKKMEITRKICELGHGERKRLGIKVRQPLAKMTIQPFQIEEEYLSLVKDELNVKEVELREKGESKVEFETKLTPILIAEGITRELIREIQQERKKAGMRLDEWVDVFAPSWPSEFEDYIKRETLTRNLKYGQELRIERKQFHNGPLS